MCVKDDFTETLKRGCYVTAEFRRQHASNGATGVAARPMSVMTKTA
ncbi:protein of unknown function [Burkholderia multivorans]